MRVTDPDEQRDRGTHTTVDAPKDDSLAVTLISRPLVVKIVNGPTAVKIVNASWIPSIPSGGPPSRDVSSLPLRNALSYGEISAGRLLQWVNVMTCRGGSLVGCSPVHYSTACLSLCDVCQPPVDSAQPVPIIGVGAHPDRRTEGPAEGCEDRRSQESMQPGRRPPAGPHRGCETATVRIGGRGGAE